MIDTTLIAWVLIAAAAIPALWLLTIYRSRIVSVLSAVRKDGAIEADAIPVDTLPAASVVVCAGDDAEALEYLLGKLFEQEYKPGMEVIVVNDGKNEDVKDVVTRMKHVNRLSNLYITFTPPRLRNISHRKLSVTLGIKAAKNPVVVVVNEQSRLYSTQWLLRMMRHFASPEVDVVLGSSLPAYKSDTKPGKRYRSFTHGADAVMWLSAALKGQPYRGDSGNLAFRRELFFTSGGFNGALNLRDGDDDIFINKISTAANTRVELSPHAQVRYRLPSSRHQFRNRRPRRFFTAALLRRSAPRLFGASSLMAYIFVLLTVAAVALSAVQHNWVQLGVSVALILLLWLPLMIAWRKTLRALRCRRTFLALPLMILMRPLTNAFHKLKARHRRQEFYTWS
jgi:glycosyltransferase involved in cell wall biosynthesis